VLAGVGSLLLLAMLFGFSESATLDPTSRLAPSVIARNYIRVLTHPSCLGYLLVSAAAFGSLFAYVSGSPLFLINVVGLPPKQYDLVFAATSLGIMGGSFLSSRLNALQVGAGGGDHDAAVTHDPGRLDAPVGRHPAVGPGQPRIWADHAQRDGASDAAAAADCRRRGCGYGLHPDGDGRRG
jgi:hypothetical protein